MKTLINKQVTPVGGWRYEDPDTGYKYDKGYNSYAKLTNHIIGYRQINNLKPIENMEIKIFDWLCQQKDMEQQCCDISHNTRTFKQYLKGGTQTLKSLISNEFVPQHIAEKRAEQCTRCPFNQHIKDDIPFYSTGFLYPFTFGRQVKSQNKLFTCKLCNCILAVKVHHTKKSIHEGLEKEELVKLQQVSMDKHNNTMKCWQIKDVY